MSFVNDHVQPFDFAEKRSILDDVFKSRQQHLETALPNLHLKVASHLWRAFVNNLCNGGRPLVEFQIPIGQRPVV